MTFAEKRQNLLTVLEQTGIASKNIAFSKDTIPRAFPAAIVVLQGEKGKNATSKRFCKIEYDVAVFLIADVNNSVDPDVEILNLASTFKTHYQTVSGSDIPKIDYYPARADSGRKVRIAKVYTVV